MADTLLLVEDEEGVRESLSEFLALQGYQLVVAAGESAAWILAQKHHPVVVVSDHNLADGTGLSLLRRLKQAPPSGVEPFCVLITGYGTLESAVDALRAGVDDLLTKPFSLLELQGALDKARAAPVGLPSTVPTDLRRLDHELAAPLAHLASYLDMMEQGLFGPLGLVQGAKLASMQLGLRRALLALAGARLRAGEALRSRPETLQADSLFRLVFNEFHLDFERRGVSVVQSVPPNLPLVRVDRHAAYLAFEALLAGLLLRAHPGQVLRMQWRLADAQVTLELAVDGEDPSEDGLWQDLPGLDWAWLGLAGLEMEAPDPRRLKLRFRVSEDADA